MKHARKTKSELIRELKSLCRKVRYLRSVEREPEPAKLASKRTEKGLRDSEERFRASIENLLNSFGIYRAIRDETGDIVDFQIEYVNAAACKSNHMTKEEQVGKRLCELLPAHRESGLFDEYCRVVETGKPTRGGIAGL